MIRKTMSTVPVGIDAYLEDPQAAERELNEALLELGEGVEHKVHYDAMPRSERSEPRFMLSHEDLVRYGVGYR